MEESQELTEALTTNDTEFAVDVMDTPDQLVVQMIDSIDTPHIENTLLSSIYKQL